MKVWFSISIKLHHWLNSSWWSLFLKIWFQFYFPSSNASINVLFYQGGQQEEEVEEEEDDVEEDTEEDDD